MKKSPFLLSFFLLASCVTNPIVTPSGNDSSKLNQESQFNKEYNTEHKSFEVEAGNTGTVDVSFGSSVIPDSYVEIDIPWVDVDPFTTTTLTADSFDNGGNNVTGTDKWTWTVRSPKIKGMSIYRGYITYDGSGNTADFNSMGPPGPVEVHAVSKDTGKRGILHLNINDVPAEVYAISPIGTAVTLPSTDDTSTDINLSAGSIYYLSVTFYDANATWGKGVGKTAYERTMALTGVGKLVPNSQAYNYGIYVGDFAGNVNTNYVAGYTWYRSGDKSLYTVTVKFRAQEAGTGYVVVNARQNNIKVRNHRWNITVL